MDSEDDYPDYDIDALIEEDQEAAHDTKDVDDGYGGNQDDWHEFDDAEREQAEVEVRAREDAAAALADARAAARIRGRSKKRIPYIRALCGDEEYEGEASSSEDERNRTAIAMNNLTQAASDMSGGIPLLKCGPGATRVENDARDVVSLLQPQRKPTQRSAVQSNPIQAAAQRFIARAEAVADVNLPTPTSVSTVAVPTKSRQYLYSRPPVGKLPDCNATAVDSQEVVLPDGELLYVAILDEDHESKPNAPSGSRNAAGTVLLSQPIGQMLLKVKTSIAAENSARMRRVLASAGATLRDVTEILEDGGDGGPTEEAVGVTLPPAPHTGPSRAPALWVDKYAPHGFADLLSSEQINRNVLRWIKLWDERVFKRTTPSLAAATAPRPSGISGMFGAQQKGGSSSTAPVYAGAALRPLASRENAAGKGTASRTGFGAAPKPSSGGGDDARSRIMQKFGFGWRSDAKVILLCGPPGTGKTTLAHIAAKHAGYTPIEINASDDRSGKTIRERITAAQGMKPVFGEGKPTLIILDEIDGMEGGGPDSGVHELCKMIRATPSIIPRASDASGGDESHAVRPRKADGDGSDDDDMAGDEDAPEPKRASSGKQKEGRKRARMVDGPGRRGRNDIDIDDDAKGAGKDAAVPLTRPLICICNDQYAPCLRELRPLVQVVEFASAPPERLIARLKAICRAERLAITQDAVQMLASLTDYDIRACLNTLQFIKYQTDKSRTNRREGAGEFSDTARITSETILRASIGVKDQTKAVFDVWSSVFKRQDARARQAAAMTSLGVTVSAEDIRLAHGSGTDARTLMGMSTSHAAAARNAQLQELMAQLAAYTAEPRLLLAGLHENMLHARVNDPTLQHTWSAEHWLSYGDVLQARASSHQAQVLLKYLPAVGLAFHSHLASELRMKIVWPRNDSAMRAAAETRRNVVQTFLMGWAAAAGTAAAASLALDQRGMALDILSPLLTIVSPPLRPVNFGLMNSKEKREAQALVDVLASTGLTYAAKHMGARQPFGDEDSYELSPAITDLVAFDGYNPWDPEVRGKLPEVLKPLVAHEVRLARIRQMHKRDREKAAAKGDEGKDSKAGAHALPAHIQAQIDNASSGTPSLPIALEAETQAIEVVAAAPSGLAFLAAAAERSRAALIVRKRTAIAASEAVKTEARATAALTASLPVEIPAKQQTFSVIYRFQEGFTNAVRRPVRIADFM